MPVLFQINDSDNDQILKDKLRKIFDHITKRLDSADKTTDIVERVITTSESGGGSSSLIAHASTHEDGGTDKISHDSLVDFVVNEHLPGIDEDDMVSDSDVHVPTQQSVKAYVDDAVTPGGSNTEIQFNDGGVFGGDTYLIWDKTNHKLSISPTHSYDYGDCIHIENLTINSANDYHGFVGIFKKTDGASDKDTYYIGGQFQMRISDSDKVHGPTWGLYIDAYLELGTIGAVGTNRNLCGIEVDFGTVSGSTVNGNVFGIYIDGENLGTVSGRKYDIWIEDNPPKIGLRNDTSEDIDGGRESYIDILGKQSGGEESILARIGVSHDGTGDDQKGDLIFYTNDGNDGDSPTERLRIDSTGAVTLSSIKSGADQASAGAAAGEIWKTASHATLPDNVLMIGV